MAYSLMNSPSPWDSAGHARPWAKSRQAAGHEDVRTAAEDHDGATEIPDVGLVCLLFDD